MRKNVSNVLLVKPRINRRGWLALWVQKRRRARAAAQAEPIPAIQLASDGHGHLTWTVNFTTPYDGINIYWSHDGVTWGDLPYDGSDLASGSRDCSGAPPGFFRICVCDWDGNDQAPYSNGVYSDGS